MVRNQNINVAQSSYSITYQLSWRGGVKEVYFSVFDASAILSEFGNERYNSVRICTPGPFGIERRK